MMGWIRLRTNKNVNNELLTSADNTTLLAFAAVCRAAAATSLLLSMWPVRRAHSSKPSHAYYASNGTF